jgi:hypothetical protein
MNALSRPRRWRPRSLALGALLGALLLAGLVATLNLAPTQASTRADATLRALGGWLRPTRWAWPLAAALAVAALASPPARRRWPRPAHRIPPAIAMFAGLVGLASLATVSRPRLGVLVVGVAMAVGLLAAWVAVLPRRLAPSLPKQDLDAVKEPDRRLELADARTKLQDDLRTTALQAVAGLAVLAGAVLGFQQLTEDRRQATATQELTRQGQASERFTRAIDQLGSDRREVQLGGIYGLEQIARQAPDNRLAVTEVLVAYLHRRAPQPVKPTSQPGELRSRAPDVQAALTVLGRRRVEATDRRLDLQKLDLFGADVHAADLRHADFSGADLRHADFRRADLHDAKLDGADLHDADLNGADLSDASLSPADLRGADLHDANLSGAILSLADLRGANLGGANLRGAYLSHASLSPADLRGAIADQFTSWPAGFDWRGAGIKLG